MLFGGEGIFNTVVRATRKGMASDNADFKCSRSTQTIYYNIR